MTLETLLKQVEASAAKARVSAGAETIEAIERCYCTAAPILVEVIRELVRQRDDLATDVWHFPHGAKTTRKIEIAKLNTDLDAIVAKRLKGEE